MILEIAAGIVLAVVVLWLLPALLALGAILIAAAAVLAVTGVVIYGFVTGHSEIVLGTAALAGLVVAMLGAAMIERRTGIDLPDQVCGGILASICVLGLLAAAQEAQESGSKHWQAILIGTMVALVVLALLARSALRTFLRHRERQRAAAEQVTLMQQRQSATAVENWRKVFAERKRLNDGASSASPPHSL